MNHARQYRPPFRGGFDFGIPFPNHSSLWFRPRGTAAAARGSIRDLLRRLRQQLRGRRRDQATAVLRVARIRVERVSGRTFAPDGGVERPPVIFEGGTPSFHATWLRPSIFASALWTDPQSSTAQGLLQRRHSSTCASPCCIGTTDPVDRIRCRVSRLAPRGDSGWSRSRYCEHGTGLVGLAPWRHSWLLVFLGSYKLVRLRSVVLVVVAGRCGRVAYAASGVILGLVSLDEHLLATARRAGRAAEGADRGRCAPAPHRLPGRRGHLRFCRRGGFAMVETSSTYTAPGAGMGCGSFAASAPRSCMGAPPRSSR